MTSTYGIIQTKTAPKHSAMSANQFCDKYVSIAVLAIVFDARETNCKMWRRDSTLVSFLMLK